MRLSGGERCSHIAERRRRHRFDIPGVRRAVRVHTSKV